MAKSFKSLDVDKPVMVRLQPSTCNKLHKLLGLDGSWPDHVDMLLGMFLAQLSDPNIAPRVVDNAIVSIVKGHLGEFYPLPSESLLHVAARAMIVVENVPMNMPVALIPSVEVQAYKLPLPFDDGAILPGPHTMDDDLDEISLHDAVDETLPGTSEDGLSVAERETSVLDKSIASNVPKAWLDSIPTPAITEDDYAKRVPFLSRGAHPGCYTYPIPSGDVPKQQGRDSILAHLDNEGEGDHNEL